MSVSHRNLLLLGQVFFFAFSAAISDSTKHGPHYAETLQMANNRKAGRQSNSLSLEAVKLPVYYHGGMLNNYGVEVGVISKDPKVYLVFWGSQWNNNDPSNEAEILIKFFRGLGGSTYLNAVTEYCQGVPYGTQFCGTSGEHILNSKNILAGVWYDDTYAAPTHPTTGDVEEETRHAAQHFNNTAPHSNDNNVYFISTATGNSQIVAFDGTIARGFGIDFCAYHYYTPYSPTNLVPYIYFPYITDAGYTCGANFNGLGENAGITLLASHEYLEFLTWPFDQFGWAEAYLDNQVADKCAWTSTDQPGAYANIELSTGIFPVVSSWSNLANDMTGGCILYQSDAASLLVTNTPTPSSLVTRTPSMMPSQLNLSTNTSLSTTAAPTIFDYPVDTYDPPPLPESTFEPTFVPSYVSSTSINDASSLVAASTFAPTVADYPVDPYYGMPQETVEPSQEPTFTTTIIPSSVPVTKKPSSVPVTKKPSSAPVTKKPSLAPSFSTSTIPSSLPVTKQPSLPPSYATSTTPSSSPVTKQPSLAPSFATSTIPSSVPVTKQPSLAPSFATSTIPSSVPVTKQPSSVPTFTTSTIPSSVSVTKQPSLSPSFATSAIPSSVPVTKQPLPIPSSASSTIPSSAPFTKQPSSAPSFATSTIPSTSPVTKQPSLSPSFSTTRMPTTVSTGGVNDVSINSAIPTLTPSKSPIKPSSVVLCPDQITYCRGCQHCSDGSLCASCLTPPTITPTVVVAADKLNIKGSGFGVMMTTGAGLIVMIVAILIIIILSCLACFYYYGVPIGMKSKVKADDTADLDTADTGALSVIEIDTYNTTATTLKESGIKDGGRSAFTTSNKTDVSDMYHSMMSSSHHTSTLHESLSAAVSKHALRSNGSIKSRNTSLRQTPTNKFDDHDHDHDQFSMSDVYFESPTNLSSSENMTQHPQQPHRRTVLPSRISEVGRDSDDFSHADTYPEPESALMFTGDNIAADSEENRQSFNTIIKTNNADNNQTSLYIQENFGDDLVDNNNNRNDNISRSNYNNNHSCSDKDVWIYNNSNDNNHDNNNDNNDMDDENDQWSQDYAMMMTTMKRQKSE